MKLHSVLVLAAGLGSAAAQGSGMDGLPSCAQSCATDSIPKKCSMIDIACICGDSSFITNISCCVAKTCGSAEQEGKPPLPSIKFANQICSGAGITDLPQSASCAGGSSETSGASSATSTSQSTNTASGASATTTGASSDTTGTATAHTGESTGSGSSTTASASASATTGAAALLQVKDTGVLAGVGAALFAFFA
ncbi:hypothetical protein BDV59DRAFT_198815 [Aspergillus ambiguus]|uniref:CFEM domain-containing protein n=1 Tax=Aspergillus ambiguus TaxID=176160 RepID=UPI003CCD0D08